jgi:hypothetical protein
MIIIFAVVLILAFGYYDQLKKMWIILGSKGEDIGAKAVT